MEPKSDNFITYINNHPSSSAASAISRTDAVHLYRNPSSNPNQFHLKPHEEDPNPDPDPEPISNGASNSKRTSLPPPTPTPAANDERNCTVRYRECLKNHAASMGTRVVDGCGEFMPNGEEGTPEALKCAACDCHRNFHRKEENGVVYPLAVLPPPPPPPRHSVFTMPPPPLPQHHPHHHHRKNGPSTPVMMNFSVYGGGGTAAESSSEDLKTSLNKKRFRTKFTQEQKEKMHDFAEKVGWRFQKQDEQELQHFCNEVGIKRQVLKVWMHNNKQAMKKKEI